MKEKRSKEFLYTISARMSHFIRFVIIFTICWTFILLKTKQVSCRETDKNKPFMSDTDFEQLRRERSKSIDENFMKHSSIEDDNKEPHKDAQFRAFLESQARTLKRIYLRFVLLGFSQFSNIVLF